MLIIGLVVGFLIGWVVVILVTHTNIKMAHKLTKQLDTMMEENKRLHASAVDQQEVATGMTAATTKEINRLLKLRREQRGQRATQ